LQIVRLVLGDKCEKVIPMFHFLLQRGFVYTLLSVEKCFSCAFTEQIGWMI